MLTEQGERTVLDIRAELMSGLTALEHLTPDERHTLHTLLGRAFPETAAPQDRAPLSP